MTDKKTDKKQKAIFSKNLTEKQNSMLRKNCIDFFMSKYKDMFDMKMHFDAREGKEINEILKMCANISELKTYNSILDIFKMKISALSELCEKDNTFFEFTTACLKNHFNRIVVKKNKEFSKNGKSMISYSNREKKLDSIDYNDFLKLNEEQRNRCEEMLIEKYNCREFVERYSSKSWAFAYFFLGADYMSMIRQFCGYILTNCVFSEKVTEKEQELIDLYEDEYTDEQKQYIQNMRKNESDFLSRLKKWDLREMYAKS